MKASEVLRDARKLIEKPERWLQGEYGHKEKGYCALGAVAAVKNVNPLAVWVTGYGRVVDYLDEALPRSFRPSGWIRSGVDFNDTHSHRAVMLWFTRAIQLAVADGD